MSFDTSAAWLKALRDPETHEELVIADEKLLDALRSAIAAGRARRHDGGDIARDFEAAFLVGDLTRAYLVVDGIPNFIIHERVELDAPLR